MWLLSIDTGKLEAFDSQPPEYAILSHRWQKNEVTFDDAKEGLAIPVPGKDYSKILGFCERVHSDTSIRYVWIDTCCIDKRNNVELSEAINSMYRWYAEASHCCVYLADVDGIADDQFQQSEWFKRGWTLQELIAPKHLIFYDRSWSPIGDRYSRRSEIHTITGIPKDVLDRYTHKRGFVPGNYSIADRMSWAADRQTTRVEDIAYSLLGLFEVNMPLIYGEGERAFYRLQQEILRQSDDASLLAWERDGMPDFNTIARSPSSFKRDRSQITWEAVSPYQFQIQPSNSISQGATITSVGITMSLMLKPCFLNTYFVPVCWTKYSDGSLDTFGRYLCVVLARRYPSGHFYRTTFEGRPLTWLTRRDLNGMQIRTVVLGRGQTSSNGEDFGPETFWKLSITNIAPSIPAEGVDVISRSCSKVLSGEQHVPLGTSGVASMIRFTLDDGSSFFLLIGHDFDFNLFCLSLHMRTNMAETNDAEDKAATFSSPSLRSEPFDIASNEDMMELVTTMRKMNIWSLREHDTSGLYLLWNNELSTVFQINQLFKVNINYDRFRTYTISIDTIETCEVLPEKTNRDGWIVQPWTTYKALPDTNYNIHPLIKFKHASGIGMSWSAFYSRPTWKNPAPTKRRVRGKLPMHFNNEFQKKESKRLQKGPQPQRSLATPSTKPPRASGRGQITRRKK